MPCAARCGPPPFAYEGSGDVNNDRELFVSRSMTRPWLQDDGVGGCVWFLSHGGANAGTTFPDGPQRHRHPTQK